MNFLEKRASEFSEMDENTTIEMAISAMQYVLSTDFKGSEIEIGVVSKSKKLRKLNEEEIEERLNSISERSDI